jgi:hypothetical protein
MFLFANVETFISWLINYQSFFKLYLCMEKFQAVHAFILVLCTSIGGLIAWIGVRKFEKNKAISSLRKETKINNVEGDEAILNQLDSLLLRVASMAQVIIEKEKLKSISDTKILAYQSAFNHLRIFCSEFCENPDLCNSKLFEISKKFNLDHD